MLPGVRRDRKAAIVAVTALLVLSACGSEESESSGASSTARDASAVDQAASTSPAEVILTAEDAPAGYVAEDFYGIFGSSDAGSSGAITPQECTPLVFDTSVLLDWGAQPRDTTAVAYFTGDDGSSVIVHVDTGADGAGTPDPTLCGDVTRENASTLGTTVTSYGMVPAEVGVEGADSVAAVDLTVSGLMLDGEEFNVGSKVGERSQIITATVGSTVVTVAGTEPASMDTVAQVASAQVARLAA